MTSVSDLNEFKEKLMDPSQDEELRRLSQRTEELLSRLDTLSQSLSDQLENNPAGYLPSQTQNAEPVQYPALRNPTPYNAPIPINRHYLEKQEHSYTVPAGQSYMTTKKTAIITEHQQHYPSSHQGAPPQPPPQTNNDFVTARFDGHNFHPGANPNPIPISPEFTEFAASTPNFAPSPRQTESNFEARPMTGYGEQSHHGGHGAEPLRPSAVFSQSGPYMNVTRRHNIAEAPRSDTRLPQEPAIPDFMLSPAERPQIYTTRLKNANPLQLNDLLKWFAFAVPFFALAVPLSLIRGNPAVTIAFSCISFFFGLFFSFLAFRLIEITSQVKWANSQIVEINEKLSRH
ncbi:MAG: hypothetical protein SFT81_07720 [Candidatus Caenarcaniphilales bacterium]|nr:hypothetical protein [Candidatus Caenarcaniphilales bacterium]